MALYLAAIGLLGLALGWWLGRWSSRQHLGQAAEDWQQQLATAEVAQEESSLEVQRLAAQLSEVKIEVEETKDRSALVASNLSESEQQLAQERQRLETMAAQLEERDSQIGRQREEILGWRDQVKTVQSEHDATREDLESLTAALVDSRERNAAIEAEATQSSQRASELEDLLAARDGEDSELRAEVARLREVKNEFQQWIQGAAGREEALAHAERRLGEAGRERDELAGELASLRVRGSDLEYEVESLRAELAASVLRVTEMQTRAEEAEAERESVGQELESLLNAPLVDVDRLATRQPPTVEATPLVETVPGEPELLQAPRGAADDLQRIWGIGAVLEQTLNSLGVYHYRQIANWSESDLQWVAAHIDTFPDRIVRDGWIEQAARLYRDKQS
jgi:predicted flap endonuclease-1-like 5' DNA nuclease